VITVRYFAAAAEAAGVDTEQLPDRVVAADLVRRHPGLADVLGRCALLADGVRLAPDQPVPEGATLDVLPPFAGG
jgi:molybdopterin synthase sulfur carrier subunit